ncbi:MAG TPA: squalene/phytoene synthase family protein [Gammaproteobacteria bacterium]|jgi:phytoene synthase|nr:squalene/phytoene synthase family protein [Gammaproteobacteria bacterium]
MNPADQAALKLDAANLDYRLALTFSPHQYRPALTALFALYLEIREVLVECRDPGVAEVKLGWWQQEIESLYAGKPRHPLSQALTPFMSALVYRQPLFMDIVTGTRMDIAGSVSANFEDVKRYCYRHSGVLAELSALLSGARSEETRMAARLLGNSHRLAYITTAGVADALRGRVYFATDDLKTYGVDRHIHGEGQADAPIRALLKDYTDRVRNMYRDAFKEMPSAEGGGLITWRVLSALALKRVARLEAAGFSPGAEPVELHPLSALLAAWQGARKTG